MLGNLLYHVSDAVRSSSRVDDIDEALCASDFHALMELTKVDDFDTWLSSGVESRYKQCTGSADGDRGAGSTLALVRLTNTSLVPRPMGTRLTNTALIITGPRAKRGNFFNCAFEKG